ncbi:hypothetical protein J6S88_00250 [bacterium]|nr:hypothetical protein [bacterium]
MDSDNIMQSLLDKEYNSEDKFLKPDFNSRSGREFLAFYLHAKFKQLMAFDKKQSAPMFIDMNPQFANNFSRRLITNPKKHFLIGITGESASGKSTICKTIKTVISEFAMPVSILSTDNYFNDISELIEKHGSFDKLIESGYDIDAPSSFQLNILRQDLIDLSEGIDIKAPSYMPNGTGISIPKSLPVESKKIIIVEGIATMFDEVRDVFDIKLYVEADKEIRKKRFMIRACEERNQTPENALQQWNYLETSGGNYVKNNRSLSDFVLNGNSDLKYFSQILEYLYTVTNNFQ